MSVFECALQQKVPKKKKKCLIWFGGKCDFDPTAECKLPIHLLAVHLVRQATHSIRHNNMYNKGKRKKGGNSLRMFSHFLNSSLSFWSSVCLCVAVQIANVSPVLWTYPVLLEALRAATSWCLQLKLKLFFFCPKHQITFCMQTLCVKGDRSHNIKPPVSVWMHSGAIHGVGHMCSAPQR